MLEDLARQLAAAAAAAESVAGGSPHGVRAVEPVPSVRYFLCALEGPAFLCLTADGTPERSAETVSRVGTCALIVERVEELIDADELGLLVGLSQRLGGMPHTAHLAPILADVGEAAEALAMWRSDPARAVAAMHEIDRAVTGHDRARRAYTRFLEASEPLVSVQASLPDEVFAALRDLDEVAGRIGLGGPLATDVGGAFEAADAGATEIVATHVTPLD
jgi:hypothetical protein